MVRPVKPIEFLAVVLTLTAAGIGLHAPPAAAQAGRPGGAGPAAGRVEVHRDSIPGTLVTFEMVAVAAGAVTLEGPDGPRTVEVPAFHIGRTEVTWDLYDVFALGLDTAATLAGGADAIARPSRPYGAPDRGWGHAGYPAISIAFAAAQAFCEWLSAKTGHRYRLPSEAEWLRAAALAVGPTSAETPGPPPLPPALRNAIAWHGGSAGGRTHPVGSLEPDALGLHDLFGNAAEWVVGDDGRRVVRGGSYRDPPEAVGPGARAAQDASWTLRDPQLPKSRWWLSDAPFVGFRIVREP